MKEVQVSTQEKKAKEEKARKEAERQRKLAPDKDKLLNLSVQIDILEFPDMKTEEGKSVLKNVEKLLEKVSTYIKNKTKEI